MGTEIICENLECTNLEDVNPEGTNGICCLPTLLVNEYGECMRERKDAVQPVIEADACKMLDKKYCREYSRIGEDACKKCE